jgi:hypothetical protein
LGPFNATVTRIASRPHRVPCLRCYWRTSVKAASVPRATELTRSEHQMSGPGRPRVFASMLHCGTRLPHRFVAPAYHEPCEWSYTEHDTAFESMFSRAPDSAR